MLGFKESQTAQLLDYYNETDLDTIDDQPVDYSKKYADHDTEEACVSRNKRPISTTESIDNSKTPYDELKVYCIEGTPLIISSASSMSDLRELGPSQTSENFKLLEEKVPSFQALPEISAIKESEEIEQKSEVCELDNTCGKNEKSHRNEENFSKASSPLMFSRSSSVGSLNSFEMQSIRDDRSSVSVFSTLTSGLISPSDIPDSPGEAMSPFIHKNKFSFPNSNNEKSMDPFLDNFKNNSSEQFENVFDDIPEDNVKIYDDEGDFSSISNFSALTHHTTHTSSSRMSFTVFHTETDSNLDHVSSVKIKYSLKSSEQSADKSHDNNNANPLNHESPLSNHNCEVRMEKVKEVGDSAPSLNVSIEDNEQKNIEEYSKENSDDEALIEECIKNEIPCTSFAAKLSKETQSESSTQVEKSFTEALSEVEPTYSDDESDDLLDPCILLGKPESKNTSMDLSKSPNVSPVHSTINNRVQENSPVQNCLPAYCENDASDEENDLLADCIQLGRPQSVKSMTNLNRDFNSTVLSSTCNRTPQFPVNKPLKSDPSNQMYPSQSDKTIQTCTKGFYENDVSDDDLLEDCIQLGRPQSVKSNYTNSPDLKSKVSPTSNRNCDPQSSQVKLLKSNVSYQQMYPHHNKPVQNKCPQTCTEGFYENDVVSDEELLADCIQLGRPQSVKSSYTNSPDLKSKVSPTSTRNCVPQSSQVKLLKSNVSYQQMYPHHNKPVQNFKKSRANPNVAQPVPMRYHKNTLKQSDNKEAFRSSTSRSYSPLGYRDNIPDGTSDVEEDDNDDDDLMAECIRAGKPSVKTPEVKQSLPSPIKILPTKPVLQKKPSPKDDRASLQRKPNSLSQRRLFDSEYLRTNCISPSSMIDIDSMCVYRTEDTPLLSPTASISDLSTLSFSEDKIGRGYYLNNSRNSDCSSESEDDELLLQCIRSGMPGNKRALA